MKLILPYDGDRFFGKDAIKDVEHSPPDPAEAKSEALIGHLVFVRHEDTDLSTVLGLAERFGAFSCRIPIRSPDLPDADALRSDEHRFRLETKYHPAPSRPKVIPIQLEVEVADPDHHDGILRKEDVGLDRMSDKGKQRFARSLAQYPGFTSYLMLTLTARVTLPARAGVDKHMPRVRAVKVTLPSANPPPASSISLHSQRSGPLLLNSQANSLEWTDIKMNREGSTARDAPRHFVSNKMALQFDVPGELFRERSLEVEAEIEIPDELLSGADVRFFDARGQQRTRDGRPLTVRTILRNKCTVMLADAFASRYVIPFQSFAFDEIVPDPARLEDIIAALKDQRFAVDEPYSREKKKLVQHLLVATRVEGPRTMHLFVFVEGRRRATRRESRQPSGRRYRSKFDSGYLRIYVRGRVRGESKLLTHEINILQANLRDRFDRLRAHR